MKIVDDVTLACGGFFDQEQSLKRSENWMKEEIAMQMSGKNVPKL